MFNEFYETTVKRIIIIFFAFIANQEKNQKKDYLDIGFLLSDSNIHIYQWYKDNIDYEFLDYQGYSISKSAAIFKR